MMGRYRWWCASIDISYGFDLHEIFERSHPHGAHITSLHSLGRFETKLLHPSEDTLLLVLWLNDGPMSLVVCASLDISYGFDLHEAGRSHLVWREHYITTRSL